MKKYNLANNISGWAVFAVSAATYLLTMEPTASLWDCGEFIASGLKLQIAHPPGNPVFMIMTRFFTLFAGGDPAKIALTANAMSAFASAFTILFLFWSITHLAKKLIIKNAADISLSEIIAVMSAGVVGALAYNFSDSFWFSAVEGEVYAASSFFTAIVVWVALKWEDAADEPYADRWLILIAFLMGLSIGVHLLNLLTIPAIVLIYYFRKYEFSWKGFASAFSVGVVALALLMYGIMPGIVTISSRFDLFFVNTLGMAPNSGMTFHVTLTALLMMFAIKLSLSPAVSKKIVAATTVALFFTGIWIVSESGFLNILVLILITAAVYYFAANHKRMLNMIMTMIAVILIGYSSNAIIVIRAIANPPLNENNPSNPFNLQYFLNREQYGDRPLFRGAYYTAPVIDYKEGSDRYSLDENGKYIVTSRKIERIYDPRFLTLFPRMYSDQSDHRQVYEEWGEVKGTPIQITDPSSGERRTVRKPTFVENMRFAMSYQVGYMYWRYFMWNFSGRQNDAQGTGGALHGNWITGIGFLDESRTGTAADAPDYIKNDPSRNKYYLLPFILGLAGLFYHLNNDKRNWSVILLLFVMTGLAIVFYLNQTPNQPRERDYAYVGSFYFFAVWIGLGVAALYDALSKLTGKSVAAPLAGVLCCIVPAIMAVENWDDHDRSGRYLTRDVAFNYLNSCAPNAILLTNGDNDTFPLWYAQEVEGMRTDVRVANLMLLNTDWYIDQMKRRTYESAPLPISLPAKKYYDGVNNQVFIVERTQEPVDISTVIEWINSDNMATKVQVSPSEVYDIIPTRTIRIPVDADKVIASGTVKPEDRDEIVPYIDITLRGNSIIKSQLVVLDILANNNWERPIYFVAGFHNDTFGLEEYFQLEGIAYRLVPIRSENRGWLDYGRIDADILYDNMMNKFAWGGANDPKVYLDHFHKRTLLVVRARLNYARLAKALIERGDNEKALEVLERCMYHFPLANVPYDPYFGDIIDAYFQVGAVDKATEMAIDFKDYHFERLSYYLRQNQYVLSSAEYEIQTAFQYTARVADSCERHGNPELAAEINDRLEAYYREYTVISQRLNN